MMNLAEKKPSVLLNLTISDFLQENGRSSELLESLGISIQGNEDKTLMEVCTAQQKNEDEVVKEIRRFKMGRFLNYPEGIFNWSPELVIHYLEEEHHNYTRSLLRDINYYGERAWDVHGTQYSELNQVKWYVEKLKGKLEMHIKFEENKFFPMTLRFFGMNGDIKHGTVQSLKKQVDLVEKDQKEIAYLMGRLRDLTKKFTPPKEACTTFRLLYSNLQKLDEDLEKHHFLEEQYVLYRLRSKLRNLQNAPAC
ncbi:hemerythrin domain-containing protein [Gracilimonas tropica]|uniref:hemerythrin domain-containing protein n=1 Tax=Gracilimonas tropica TaxID=454600 RepID=UPI0003666424|nr:hemerythrin domain-containing protein [Gracilimonas tropica]